MSTRVARGGTSPRPQGSGWELAVWLGYSNGRLVPPPTKVFATIVELAKSGELSRHIATTLSRVAAGFALALR